MLNLASLPAGSVACAAALRAVVGRLSAAPGQRCALHLLGPGFGSSFWEASGETLVKSRHVHTHCTWWLHN